MKLKNERMRNIGWYILNNTQPEVRHPTKKEQKLLALTNNLQVEELTTNESVKETQE